MSKSKSKKIIKLVKMNITQNLKTKEKKTQILTNNKIFFNPYNLKLVDKSK